MLSLFVDMRRDGAPARRSGMVSVCVTVVDGMGFRNEEASSSLLKMLVVSIGRLCRVSNCGYGQRLFCGWFSSVDEDRKTEGKFQCARRAQCGSWFARILWTVPGKS